MLKVKKSETVLILIFIIFAFLFFKNQLVNLFKTDFSNEGYYYSSQFDLPAHWINTDNLQEIGATSIEGPNGIIYKFPKKNTDQVYLKFLFGKPYEEINEKYKDLRYVEISNDSGWRKELNYSNLHIGDNMIALSNSLSGQSSFNIYLKTLPSHQGKYSELAIRRIEVSVLPESKKFLPNLSLIITAIIIPLFLFYCFETIGLSLILSFIYAFTSSAIFYLFLYFNYDFVTHFHLFLLLLIYLFYILIIKIRKIEGKYIYSFLLIILLVIAVHLRWSEIGRVTFAIPHPDAGHPSDGMGYRQLADNMRLFNKEGLFAVKENQPHEPFYPCMVKIFFSIFGSSDLHLRFVSFLFSILAIFLTYIVGKEIFKNRNIALMASGLMTINSYLIEQASFGLRLELEMCFLLSLFYFCYLKREVFKNWSWIILSGTLGGLWLLTKSYNIPVILFIFGYSAFSKKRWSLLKKITAFILLSVFSISFLLPYKLNLHRAFGSLFSDSYIYTTQAANTEFAGQPGFPRSNVKPGEYFFQLHTPSQFVGYHLIGIVGIFYFLSEQIFNVINEQNHLLKIFLNERFKGLVRYPLLILKIILISFLTIFSVLFCLTKRNQRLIIYIIIIGCFANLFLYGANIIKGVVILQPLRTIAHLLPFVAFCIAHSVNYIFAILIKLITRKKYLNLLSAA